MTMLDKYSEINGLFITLPSFDTLFSYHGSVGIIRSVWDQIYHIIQISITSKQLYSLCTHEITSKHILFISIYVEINSGFCIIVVR